MSSSPDGIYEPGVIDPGFPVANPTAPFWLSEPAEISKLQSPWSGSADVVIIGSGMTAANLARTLYSRRPGLKVVLVEARDVCSGATGRNGGHIKAMSPGSWFDRKQHHGVQEALRIMEFEHSHLDKMASCIKENNIKCDLHLVEGLDVYHDETIFRRALNALDDMRQHSPSLAAHYSVYTSRSDLKARKLADHCIGAIGMPAASMWPYKMVTALLKDMVENNGLMIQANTRVTSVVDDDKEGLDFATVKTDRGDIRAKAVVHATNAWMSHLVPELRAFVSPVRANVQRQVPQESSQLNRTYWIRYAEHDYDYMIQRPDGSYILGRANTGRRATTDDSTKDLLPHTHLRAVTPLIFDMSAGKLETTHAWSGGVAFTQDGNPFIGRIPFPNRRHQWVCAAYQGIGMVRAFRSAETLALMILGEELQPDFPKSMLVTDARVKSLNRSLGSRL